MTQELGGEGQVYSHLSRIAAAYLFWSLLARLVRQQVLPRIWDATRKSQPPGEEDLKKEALHRDKWMYDIWNFVVYAAMNVSNAWLWFSPWLWDGDSWGCYADGPADPALEPTYGYVFGLYLHLLEWEILVWAKTEEAAKRRIYVVHHIVVLGLMAFSWLHGWLRWGIVLILWHDVADPPMALAKMGVHLWGDDNLWSDLWFSVFVAAFTIPRLLWYPYYILGQVYKCVDLRFITGGTPPWEASITEWAIVAMLHVLWACHWIWMFQIIRFAVKKFLPSKTQTPSGATVTSPAKSAHHRAPKIKAPAAANHITDVSSTPSTPSKGTEDSREAARPIDDTPCPAQRPTAAAAVGASM